MLTHLKKNLKPKIVDIGKKKITSRTAIAEGIVKFKKSTFKKLETYKNTKGEVNNIAILAGIMGAKKTSELIPLCHNIKIENIDINIKTNKALSSLIVTAIVSAKAKNCRDYIMFDDENIGEYLNEDPKNFVTKLISNL